MGVWWADRNDCLNVYDSIIVYRPPLPHFSLLSHSLPKPASPFTTNKDNLCLWLYVHAQKINQHFCTSFSPNHQENWTGFLFLLRCLHHTDPRWEEGTWLADTNCICFGNIVWGIPPGYEYSMGWPDHTFIDWIDRGLLSCIQPTYSQCRAPAHDKLQSNIVFCAGNLQLCLFPVRAQVKPNFGIMSICRTSAGTQESYIASQARVDLVLPWICQIRLRIQI